MIVRNNDHGSWGDKIDVLEELPADIAPLGLDDPMIGIMTGEGIDDKAAGVVVMDKDIVLDDKFNTIDVHDGMIGAAQLFVHVVDP